MSKPEYKVVTNGTKFKVKRKGFFGRWKDVRAPRFWGLVDYCLEFDNREKAKELMEALKGEDQEWKDS